jgi:XTP/dITP diphosphohydrolase
VQKLLLDLANVPTAARSARFQCVLVYLRHPEDPTPLIAQGCWEGTILKNTCGENGFGYDPVFYIPTLDCTSAQLDAQTKNQHSHRAQALKQLVSMLGAV